MLSSKLEKIGIVAIWYFLLFIATRIVPVSSPNALTTTSYCLVVTAATIFICKIYVEIRDNCIEKTIRHKALNNELDLCLEYIEKCINKNKKIFWLQFERVLLLALMGRILQYQESLNDLKKLNYFFNEERYSNAFDYFDCLFLYLKEKKIPNFSLRYEECNTDIEKIVWLLTNMQSLSEAQVESYANVIMDSQYFLYKSFACLIIYEKCRTVNDRKSDIYFHKAKSYAPSKEYLEYLDGGHRDG